jgi:fatty-acyl-CoA synthase
MGAPMSLNVAFRAAGEAKATVSVTKPWLRALELTARIDDRPRRTLPIVIDELAESAGDAPALVSEEETLSYAALAERSRRYARWALAERVQPGETVCLLMPNRPEYLAVWLGISRVGGVVALLNTNLRGSGLAHAITVARPGHVIVDERLLGALGGLDQETLKRLRVWTVNRAGHGKSGKFGTPLEVARYDGGPIAPGEARLVTLADRALCIYTSGTTGLPKAANVSHHRLMMWSHWFAGVMLAGPSDRLYDCLPMYHSIGGVVAPASMLVSGGSVALRERFSATRFWEDIERWDCTIFQYIGELCRYLTKSPRHPAEVRHRLRLACGNGLRGEVWAEFKERFKIPHILEFFAATEANFSLYNVEERPGAIGRIPPFLAHRFPAAIVRFDAARGEPVRGEDGRCVRCARNEVGEALGRIGGGQGLASRFEGYTSDAESAKKVLRDVFAPGDAWFRTGDLMRQDEKGFFYFVERIGGSFRWKGENVSTSEVAEVIAACPGVTAAQVYGVAVSGSEGRAGMAALSVDTQFDLTRLHAHVHQSLPSYARPLFLRKRAALDFTETFKPKTHHLAREGFDPSAIGDELLFDHPGLGAYVRLDAELFARIQAGRIRL